EAADSLDLGVFAARNSTGCTTHRGAASPVEASGNRDPPPRGASTGACYTPQTMLFRLTPDERRMLGMILALAALAWLASVRYRTDLPAPPPPGPVPSADRPL